VRLFGPGEGGALVRHPKTAPCAPGPPARRPVGVPPRPAPGDRLSRAPPRRRPRGCVYPSVRAARNAGPNGDRDRWWGRAPAGAVLACHRAVGLIHGGNGKARGAVAVRGSGGGIPAQEYPRRASTSPRAPLGGGLVGPGGGAEPSRRSRLRACFLLLALAWEQVGRTRRGHARPRVIRDGGDGWRGVVREREPVVSARTARSVERQVAPGGGHAVRGRRGATASGRALMSGDSFAGAGAVRLCVCSPRLHQMENGGLRRDGDARTRRLICLESHLTRYHCHSLFHVQVPEDHRLASSRFQSSRRKV
jgi:hypothetical protein